MYRKDEENNFWIGFSDLMTGLMVIFLFIAINYIIQIVENKFISQEIYNKLDNIFEKELENKTIELGPDGIIRFRPNKNKILFYSGSATLSEDFKNSLEDFIPKYLEIITDSNYIDYISEIRIEGHTDNVPPSRRVFGDVDSYTFNLALSSERAQEVLNLLRCSYSYQILPSEVSTRLDFLFTANGLAYSRALNSENEIAYTSKNKEINNRLSRRVEFKIVTTNEKLAEKIFNYDQ